MRVYVDPAHCCHLEAAADRKPLDTEFFKDNSCREFVEGFSCLLPGESLEREDGRIFRGLMLWPHSDYTMLIALQAMYERLVGGA